MALNDTGSATGVTINGIDYRVMAEADISLTPSNSENTKVPTSGKPMDKIVKRIETAESVDLAVNATELAELKSVAETREDITMSFGTADGTQYNSEGTISLGQYTSQDGKLPITMNPNDTWVPILA